MKYIFTILFLLLFSIPAMSYDYAKQGFQPLMSVNSFSKISQAEQMILGQTYETQRVDVRLERLERNVFNRIYPKLSYEQRINNIIVNYRNNNAISGLNKLEQKVFGEAYNGDTDENRIARLEQEVMGTIQTGTLISRYKNLQQIIPTYYHSSRMSRRPVDMPIMRSGGGWRGIAGSFANFLNAYSTGYPTGYTPQIQSPYINYDYGPDYSRGFYNNNGWGIHNQYYGSGAGVHILD